MTISGKGEAEMKKDKEWAFIELGKLFPSHAEMHDFPDDTTVMKCELLNKVYDILSQLDEPEVKQLERRVEELESFNDELIRDNNQFRNELDNQEVLSEEWIDKNHFETENWAEDLFKSDGESIDHTPQIKVIAVQDLQKQLVPKQEITEEQVSEYLRERSMTAVDSTLVHRENLDSKIVTEIPSIPEFVAEFLEGKEDYMLHELFDDEWLYSKHDQIAKWLYDNDEKTNRERELNLVLAHMYGYEVEVEQRYYVMNNDQRMMLVRMMDGKTITEADPFKLEDMYEAEKKAHRLTEKEIKDYDPRYWAFRKPVEELEE